MVTLDRCSSPPDHVNDLLAEFEPEGRSDFGLVLVAVRSDDDVLRADLVGGASSRDRSTAISSRSTANIALSSA
jgi:hypothetical protein